MDGPAAFGTLLTIVADYFDRAPRGAAMVTLHEFGVPSGKAVFENSCIRGRCLFGEGGFRELVQLVIPSECLTEDNNIACDRSFA